MTEEDWWDGCCDEECVKAEIVAEIRRLIHRKQYEEAIDLADRELPTRYRYAT